MQIVLTVSDDNVFKNIFLMNNLDSVCACFYRHLIVLLRFVMSNISTCLKDTVAQTVAQDLVNLNESVCIRNQTKRGLLHSLTDSLISALFSRKSEIAVCCLSTP